jgi:hypothetical protein
MTTVQALPFFPNSIAGCQLWLDAADPATFTLSGTNISAWRDKSGSNNNASVETGTPTYSGNGVVFTGSQMFNTPLSTVNNTQTFFCVLTNNSNAGHIVSVKSASLNNGYNYMISSSAQTISRFGGTAIATGATLTAGARCLFGASIAGGGNSFLYLNGSQTGFASGSASVSGSGATLAIGAYYYTTADPAPVGYLTGTINEMIMYYATLTLAQRQQVEGYLAWKWGLQGSIPTTHPYYNIAPNSQGLAIPVGPRFVPAPKSFQASSSPFSFFNPGSFVGCQLWLDAADSSTITLSGSNITQWRDKSSNAFTVSSNASYTTAAVGRASFNNLPVVSFSVNSQMNVTMAIPNSSSRSLFYVVRASSSGSGLIMPVNCLSTNGVQTYFGPSATSTGFQALDMTGIDSTCAFTYTGGSTLDTIFMMGAVANTAGTINGNTQTLTRSASPNFLTTSATYTISNGSYTRAWDLGEMLLFNVNLSTAQRQQVEGYLAWKWGLNSQLPSNHPYKNFPPGLSFILPVTRNFQQANFRPTQISGCALWLDGQDPLGTGIIPSTGVSIGTWYDKSGNGKNGTGTAATYLSGGGLAFNGTNTYFSNTSFNYDLSKRSMFVVVKVNVYTQYAGIVCLIPTPSSGSDSASTSGMSVEVGNNFIRYYANGGGYFADLANASMFTAAAIYNDNMDTRQGSQFLNGNQVALPSANYTAATSSGYVVGARWQGGVLSSPYANANFYEVLLFTGPLTTPQRQSVEGYLAWKWGLVGSLPASHPWKKFPPPPN